MIRALAHTTSDGPKVPCIGSRHAGLHQLRSGGTVGKTYNLVAVGRLGSWDWAGREYYRVE